MNDISIAPTSALAQMGPPLLSRAELISWTGISSSTLYSMTAEGRGPASVKLGKQLRYRPAAVEAWIAELEVERQAERGVAA